MTTPEDLPPEMWERIVGFLDTRKDLENLAEAAPGLGSLCFRRILRLSAGWMRWHRRQLVPGKTINVY